MLPKFLRSTLFRISSVYTMALAVCLLALGTMWWVSIRQTFISQFQYAVENESMLLRKVYDHYGQDALVTAIRNQPISQRQLAYGFFTPEGKHVAGKLTYPLKVRGQWAYYRFQDPSDNESYSWRALMTRLPDNSLMLVGGSYEVQHELLERLVKHLLLFVGAMLALMVGGSIFLSRILSSRINLFIRAVQQIAQGDLSRRVPMREKGDEFDELSGQVNHMLANIQKLTENLRQVSTDIAHDIRTPLGHLHKNLEAALQNPADSKAHIEQALEEAKRMLDIFGSMLRLAEIESGTVKSGFKTLDLSALVVDTCEAYQPSYQEQGHQLVIEAAVGISLRGDESLLRQMISNLLENGLKHTPEDTSHTAMLSLVNGKPQLVFKDNGPGIPSEEHENVLKRFYRLSKSRNVPGSGLGLSLVNAVVELHGARMKLFDAAPGFGIIITF